MQPQKTPNSQIKFYEEQNWRIWLINVQKMKQEHARRKKSLFNKWVKLDTCM